MTDALMSIEFTLPDRDLVIAVGGPPAEANAMALAVAERLGIEPPAPGKLLTATMTADELRPLAAWIKENYPNIGVRPLPMPLRAATSPWRVFRVAVDDDIHIDGALLTTIALVVDGLHEQATAWHFEPDASIGCVVADSDPLLRVTVDPSERVVFVEHLPPDTKLPDKLSPSPYSAEAHH